MADGSLEVNGIIEDYDLAAALRANIDFDPMDISGRWAVVRRRQVFLGDCRFPILPIAARAVAAAELYPLAQAVGAVGVNGEKLFQAAFCAFGRKSRDPALVAVVLVRF